MPFRLPVDTVADAGTEAGTPVSITLGAAQVATIGMTPKSSNGNAINGIRLQITAQVTQSAAASWTVGSLFAGMKIIKGGQSDVRMAINGYAQLIRLFNSLTRLGTTANMYFNDSVSAGAAGTTTQTMNVFLPLQYRTDDVIPQTILQFNPISAVTNATAASVTCQVHYSYTSATQRDDVINVVTTPTMLNDNTDIDVSTFFAGTTVYDEIWIDVIVDFNINYMTFRRGNMPKYPMVDSFALRAHTNPAIVTAAMSGFLLLKMPQLTSFNANGVDGLKNILDCNFANPVTPTFFLYSKL